MKLVQIKRADKFKVSNYLKQAARLKGHKNIKGWTKQRIKHPAETFFIESF